MPPYNECPLSFIFDIIAFRRHCLKIENLQAIPIAAILEFKVEKLVALANEDPEVARHLPDLTKTK